MAEPTAAADVAAAAPPPASGPTPPPEPTVTATATVGAEQKISHTAPPPDVPAPAPPPPARKRKVEETGFHNCAYYKIRATVADLRVRFVQVYEATNSRNSDAAREILKEIKVVMELSKKMRHDLGATFEPAKPTLEKPLAGVVKDGSAEPPPSGENNHAPQTDQNTVCSNIVNDVSPTNPNSQGVAEKIGETQISELADRPKELDEIAQGSCVTGGSPIGWNFLVWPGGKVVYYGRTKEVFLASQAKN